MTRRVCFARGLVTDADLIAAGEAAHARPVIHDHRGAGREMGADDLHL
jgi:hypothetical protein